MFKSHDLSHCIDAPREQLLAAMRRCVPKDGDDYTLEVPTFIEFGDPPVADHHHIEWTALFYHDPGDPVCAIIIDGERIEPKAGECLVLDPCTQHEVEASRSERTRRGHAMLVKV